MVRKAGWPDRLNARQLSAPFHLNAWKRYLMFCIVKITVVLQ
ncbi:hypothetical protein [Alicyclobacillus acidiphilus]|nr:hypothetical protein [Alicyclobacillus acidiphilus]